MRTLSGPAVASLMAQETGEVWLALVTIEHDDLPAPIRLVNNVEDIVSRGETFIACPLEITLPGEDPESATVATIQIDNVDRQIVQAIRSIASPPVFTIEVIMASQPDVVEISLTDMVMRNSSFDVSAVRGELSFESVYVEPVSLTMTPQRFPSLF